MSASTSVSEETGYEPSSYLFVPGNRPDRFQKAIDSGADRIILDLEDAVAPAEKDSARAAVTEWCGHGYPAVVRINGRDTYWFDADLAAVAALRQVEVMLPKADASTMRHVLHYLVDRPVIALIESVAGLLDVYEIAKMKGVSRIAFGNIDFSTDARVTTTSPLLDHARFQIAMASRNAGLAAPMAGVTTELGDEAVLVEDIGRARDFGFGAKLCIHPRQVEAVNRLFLPSRDEIEWASAIMDRVSAAGDNVIQFEGKMVDKPVIERAKYLLARARKAKGMAQA